MNRTVPIIFLLCLASLILAFPGQSSAIELCASLVDSTDVEVRSPKIAEFLASRSYDRLIKTQPESLSKVPEQIVAAPEGKTVILVDDPNVRAKISVTKANGTIDVEISYISFAAKDTGMKGIIKSMVVLGKRNRSLNMLFPRLIAAIAAGLDKLVAVDPNLQKISISGSKVLNLGLTKQLREMGFQPDRPRISRTIVNALQGEGLFASLIHSTAVWVGITSALPDPVYLTIKLAKNAIIIFAGVKYHDLGRNWKIEFHVQRQDSPQ